jgi:hypothetical protein
VAEVITGPWQDRVRFAPGGGFAYRPGQVLVRAEMADVAERRLHASLRMERDSAPDLRRESLLAGAFERVSGGFDSLEAVAALEAAGLPARPNHVLFATCCCPPHPSSPEAEAFYANPFYAKAVEAASFTAHPFYAKPFYAKAGGGGCGCCCGSMDGAPFQANPFYAKAVPSPFLQYEAQASGRRRSSARPCRSPHVAPVAPAGKAPVRVAILDTGWAETHVPTGLPNMRLVQHGGDQPDADGDRFLDPAAGHGTFIAGLIEQEAPGCDLEAITVLTTYGDGAEDEIAEVLLKLARRPDNERPHLVNLSFGGYTPVGMAALSHAVTELRRGGSIVVAAAGNDGSCAPLFPAAFPDVIAVGALDAYGNAAPFTNYGPWVQACTNGADLESIFFEGFNGAEPPTDLGDDDHFEGWATWSGTSFAAPRVVAALARRLQDGTHPADAVEELINDENLPRKAMLGTVVR